MSLESLVESYSHKNQCTKLVWEQIMDKIPSIMTDALKNIKTLKNHNSNIMVLSHLYSQQEIILQVFIPSSIYWMP